MDYVLLVLGVLSTFSGLYGLRCMLRFKRDMKDIDAHQMHLNRINKLAVRKLGIKAKNEPKGSDLSNVIGDLAQNLDMEDIDDLPIPSWLKPLAKGYIEKMMEKQGSVDNEEDSATQN